MQPFFATQNVRWSSVFLGVYEEIVFCVFSNLSLTLLLWTYFWESQIMIRVMLL